MILTIWTKGDLMQVVQLSDDPLDGTAQEQIEYLKTLDVYSGWTCVSQDYQGTFPDTDASNWYWDNSQVASKPITLPIPTLTPRQIRFVLNQANLREQVESMVALSDQYTKDWWEWSNEFKYDHPILQAMASQLGLSNVQVEAMFREGALL